MSFPNLKLMIQDENMKDKNKLLEVYKSHTLRNWSEIERSKVSIH